MKHVFKKRCMIMISAALLVFPGTTVFAKGRGAQRNDCSRQNVCTFIDADKDGICDNCNLENCRKQQSPSGQTSSGQASSGKTDSGQASPEIRPRLGCHGQRQKHSPGHGRC